MRTPRPEGTDRGEEWAALNVVLLGVELARDDPRWWKLVLTAVFALGGAAGAFDTARDTRNRRPAP